MNVNTYQYTQRQRAHTRVRDIRGPDRRSRIRGNPRGEEEKIEAGPGWDELGYIGGGDECAVGNAQGADAQGQDGGEGQVVEHWARTKGLEGKGERVGRKGGKGGEIARKIKNSRKVYVFEIHLFPIQLTHLTAPTLRPFTSDGKRTCPIPIFPSPLICHPADSLKLAQESRTHFNSLDSVTLLNTPLSPQPHAASPLSHSFSLSFSCPSPLFPPHLPPPPHPSHFSTAPSSQCALTTSQTASREAQSSLGFG